MICLGILVDSQVRTMSVPPEKLKCITDMCHEWQNKKVCSKRQLQSLLGSLLFISKCVRPARVFLNRMLEFLRLMGTFSRANVILRKTKVQQQKVKLRNICLGQMGAVSKLENLSLKENLIITVAK